MRRFWLLTYASAISKIGNRFLYVAVPWAILQKTSSPFMAMLSLGIQSAPYVVSPLLGGIVDKYDRRQLFVRSEIAQGASVALIPWLLAANMLPLVFVALIVLGLGSVISTLTSDYGLIPALVAKEQIDWAYSRYSSVIEGSRFVGPAIAGFVIAALGSSWALWIDALTFLCTALAGLFIPATARVAETRGMRVLLKEGVAAFARYRSIQRLTGALTIYNLGVGSLFALMVAVAQKDWAWDVQVIGSALSFGAAASMVGANLTMRIYGDKPIERRIGLWLAICAVGSLPLIVGSPWAALAGYYIICFGEGGMNVTTMTYRQKIIDPAFAGRVNAIVRMFISTAVSISAIILGWLGSLDHALLQFLPICAGTAMAWMAWRHWSAAEVQAAPADGQLAAPENG
jgi:MFS family permease